MCFLSVRSHINTNYPEVYFSIHPDLGSGRFRRFQISRMNQDKDLSAWSWQTAAEGEEHLCAPVHVLQASPLTTDAKVPGRIKGHHSYYEKIGAEPYVVQIVREGYKLELDTIPPPSFTKNNQSALANMKFVTAELGRLERLGCIRRVET